MRAGAVTPATRGAVVSHADDVGHRSMRAGAVTPATPCSL